MEKRDGVGINVNQTATVTVIAPKTGAPQIKDVAGNILKVGTKVSVAK